VWKQLTSQNGKLLNSLLNTRFDNNSVGLATTHNLHLRAKQADVFDLFAGFHLTGKLMRQRRFNFLPWHAGGEDCEGMSEIDHLIETATEKIIDWTHQAISQKLPEIEAGNIKIWGLLYLNKPILSNKINGL
jgi:hypothetical protein